MKYVVGSEFEDVRTSNRAKGLVELRPNQELGELHRRQLSEKVEDVTACD
jgi:hypothetical protein